MSGYSYEDEIQALALDIRRYCNNDGRIDECLTQLLKLHTAEVDALAWEARHLDRLVTRMESDALAFQAELVRSTTEREQARIEASQPDVRWVERHV